MRRELEASYYRVSCVTTLLLSLSLILVSCRLLEAWRRLLRETRRRIGIGRSVYLTMSWPRSWAKSTTRRVSRCESQALASSSHRVGRPPSICITARQRRRKGFVRNRILLVSSTTSLLKKTQKFRLSRRWLLAVTRSTASPSTSSTQITLCAARNDSMKTLDHFVLRSIWRSQPKG